MRSALTLAIVFILPALPAWAGEESSPGQFQAAIQQGTDPCRLFVQSFSCGLGLVQVGRWLPPGEKVDQYFLDSQGHVMRPQITPPFRVESFSEDLAAFQRDFKSNMTGGKWGYIDKTGKIVIEARFDYAEPFSEGLATVRVDTPGTSSCKFGFIDKSGAFVIEPQFAYANSFHEGLAHVRIGGNPESGARETVIWAFVDGKGKIALQSTQISYENGFSNGLVPFYDAIAKKYGFVDKTGIVSIPATFDAVEPFREEKAIFKMRDGDLESEQYKCGIIDVNGKVILP